MRHAVYDSVGRLGGLGISCPTAADPTPRARRYLPAVPPLSYLPALLGATTLLGAAALLAACAHGPDAPAVAAPDYRLCLTGPTVGEQSAPNPFYHYRLNVEVDGPEGAYVVPGYFAADGDAAETGARAGDQWCARLTAFAPGDYTYAARLERGDSIAIRPDGTRGELVGEVVTGEFRVSEDAGEGWLRYDPSGYPRFSESRRAFLKTGTNSPENFLAAVDFDGTYSYDTGKAFAKTYRAHVADWRPGDPTWRGGKGKGIVGAVNYLADVGVNGVYALTNNIGGDARDVWMYVSHDTLDRLDVSKLAQWERVLGYMNARGIAVQFVTQEAENETLLDGGETGPLRRLYYRELLARFGHLPMLTFNLGEENGRTPWNEDPFQSDDQRRQMVEWFEAHDPRRHPVVIHTLPDPAVQPGVLNPLLGREDLDGLSMQIHDQREIHDVVAYWRRRSDSTGHRWQLAVDEIGPWQTGSLSDAADPAHDTLRKGVLWGALTAGAYGVEWYYGWHTDQHDLNAEDFRTREGLYTQARVARELLEGLPLARMSPLDEAVSRGWCLGSEADGTYVVYLPEGGATALAVDDGAYDVTWRVARDGATVSADVVEAADGALALTAAADGDYVAVVRRAAGE